MRQWIAAVLVATLAAHATPGGAQAQAIGRAEAVLPGAELKAAGGRSRLVDGATLSVGDVVTTDASGQAQLRFTDGTKIVVGPGSTLEIDEILMQSGKTASRFAVSAVGGTFRFISGKSPKSAYSITTPTATMGIRGTAFDFSVDRNTGTNVVLFRGVVQLCARAGNCAEIRGRCTLALSDLTGGVGGAASREQKDGVIVSKFPFVVDQNSLAADYQVSTGLCGEVAQTVKTKRKAILDRADQKSSAPAENRRPEPPSNEPPTK